MVCFFRGRGCRFCFQTSVPPDAAVFVVVAVAVVVVVAVDAMTSEKLVAAESRKPAFQGPLLFSRRACMRVFVPFEGQQTYYYLCVQGASMQ